MGTSRQHENMNSDAANEEIEAGNVRDEAANVRLEAKSAMLEGYAEEAEAGRVMPKPPHPQPHPHPHAPSPKQQILALNDTVTEQAGSLDEDPSLAAKIVDEARDIQKLAGQLDPSVAGEVVSNAKIVIAAALKIETGGGDIDAYIEEILAGTEGISSALQEGFGGIGSGAKPSHPHPQAPSPKEQILALNETITEQAGSLDEDPSLAAKVVDEARSIRNLASQLDDPSVAAVVVSNAKIIVAAALKIEAGGGNVDAYVEEILAATEAISSAFGYGTVEREGKGSDKSRAGAKSPPKRGGAE